MGAPVALYAQDGVLAVGATRNQGRQAIRTFYEARARRGTRTARHLLTNFQVLEADDDRRARAAGIVSLYAGDALPPLESKPAVLIADLLNDYVREDDGIWRYRSHFLRPIFVGDDAFVRHAVTSTPSTDR